MNETKLQNSSFFKLPAIFVTIWLLTEYTWFRTVTLTSLINSVPPVYINNIIYGIRVIWINNIFLFLISTILIFYYTRLNQANIKNIIIVMIIAVIYCFLLKFSHYLIMDLMKSYFGETSHYNRPSITYQFSFGILGHIVNIIMLILMFMPRVLFYKKNHSLLIINNKNQSLLYNSFYIILTLYFTILIPVLIVYALDLTNQTPMLLGQLFQFQMQASEFTFPIIGTASLVLFLSIFKTIPFQGSKLETFRIMIVSIINAGLIVVFLFSYLIYLSIMYTDETTPLNLSILIIGTIIFIVIARAINKATFKTSRVTITP